MKISQKVPLLSCLVLVVVLSACATGKNKTTGTVLKNSIKNDVEKTEGMERYLVDIEQYTTSGAVFHKKYYSLLLSIAGEIAETGSLSITRKSVGFYYDRRSGDRERLYLGIDIQSDIRHPGEYTAAALAILRNYLSDIIDTVMSNSGIFEEKDVVGLVIGWKWNGDGYRGEITVWIDENDMSGYINDKMTMNELIQKSAVTDASGKIIRLPL